MGQILIPHLYNSKVRRGGMQNGNEKELINKVWPLEPKIFKWETPGGHFSIMPVLILYLSEKYNSFLSCWKFLSLHLHLHFIILT